MLDKGVAQLKAKGVEAKPYQDIRKLLESNEIDAVSIATPNHWHSLGGIWAIQAGKDLYVEKPVSHNVWEGRQLVKATEAHNRIVQMGVQSRSGPGQYRRGGMGEERRPRQAPLRARAVLQAPREHRPGFRRPAHSCHDRLRSLVRAGGETAAPSQEAALRLALGLEHRQWRSRQPGHSSDGHRATLHGRSGHLTRGHVHRRTARIQG